MRPHSYLFSPYTIASCLARSTSPLNSLLVVLATYGALLGESRPSANPTSRADRLVAAPSPRLSHHLASGTGISCTCVALSHSAHAGAAAAVRSEREEGAERCEYKCCASEAMLVSGKVRPSFRRYLRVVRKFDSR